MAPDVRQADPLAAYRFEVSGGDYLGTGAGVGFNRVSGLEGEIGVKEWRQLTEPSTPVKLPMEATYGDVTLERGVDPQGALMSWWNDVRGIVANGRNYLPKRTITVVAHKVFNRPGSDREWRIYAAWPRKIKWGDLDANTSGVLIESLVLANEGVERIK